MTLLLLFNIILCQTTYYDNSSVLRNAEMFQNNARTLLTYICTFEERTYSLKCHVFLTSLISILISFYINEDCIHSVSDLFFPN